MLALCALIALGLGAATAHPSCVSPAHHNLQNIYVKPVLDKLVDLYEAASEDKGQWPSHVPPQQPAQYQTEWLKNLPMTSDNAQQNRAVYPNAYPFGADKPACPHAHAAPGHMPYSMFYSPMHYLYSYMMSSAANSMKEHERKDESSQPAVSTPATPTAPAAPAAPASPANPWWPYYPMQYMMMDPKAWPPTAAPPTTTAAPETDNVQSEEVETEADLSAGLD